MNTPTPRIADSAPRADSHFPAGRGARPAIASDADQDFVRRCAELARTLADLLLANVQNTASLNVNAARALLAHADLPMPEASDPRCESWRWTWRSFEICATSADQILELTRGHVERTTGALWRGAERLFAEIDDASAFGSRSVLGAFESLRAAQTEYWRAATQAHNEVLALARAGVAATSTERDHGTH